MSASESSLSNASLTLVAGLGETGVAAARWCVRAGLPVRAADTRAEPPLLAQARDMLAPTELCLGLEVFEPRLLEGVGRVVLSPGLLPDGPELAPLLAAARAKGVPVIGEIELFAQALADLRESQAYAPAVLAVTGTNGKTTVTALATLLLNEAGRKAQAAGNIGPAAIAALMTALDAGELPDTWVLELSSFQLQTVETLAPDAAVVLNLTADHLDWHGSLEAYAAAKARIYARSRIRIVNRGDAQVMKMVAGLAPLEVRSFGSDAPVLGGDLGLDASDGIVWLAEAARDEFGSEPPARRKKNDPPPEREPGRLNRLMPSDALQIRGVHNALNAQAALLLARSLDLPWAPLLRAVREYRGEPHRLEWVRTVANVDFIDDSKGTNVGATRAALQGLGCRVVLIAGGEGKGQDFSSLAVAVEHYARAVVLIGRDASLIEQALAATGVPLVHEPSLPAAVGRALTLAQPGDAVLLSPACASFDMFDDYRHRSRVFVDAVAELAYQRGEV